MNSIRVRVLIAATLVTCLMLLLAGVSLLTLLRDGLIEQLDQRLLTAAHGLTQAFENQSGEMVFEWEGIQSGMPLVFRANDDASRVVAESPGELKLAEVEIPSLPLQYSAEPRVATAQLSDGSLARVVTLQFIPRYESDGTAAVGGSAAETLAVHRDRPILLQVAGSLNEIQRVMTLAIWRFIIVSVLATVVTSVVLWPITSFVVRPVNVIAASISHIDADLLDARVDALRCPQELKPIADRFNEFVARLQAAFAREQQTTANIAHELRTPLAGLKATLELAESKPREVAYYQQTLANCRRITDELQDLAERTLLLARLDAGRLTMVVESVDLKTMLQETWDEVFSQQPSLGLRAEWNLPNSLTLDTDPAFLRRVVRNLYTNAIQHGDQREPILISATATDAHCQLTVANICQGLRLADVPRLKERFFQADDNRSQTGRTAGLGLSICDQLVRSLRGTLELTLDAKQCFTATLRLPRKPA